MQDVKDITIIGAGPTGLFGAFYAGMRGASCRLIDNLDQVGGQLTALYPEKYIFDVAGFPKVLAKDLVKGMAEQALQFKQPVHLGENVMGLKRDSENGKPAFTVVTEKDEYPSRTVLIAGGMGAFTPRKLPPGLNLTQFDRFDPAGWIRGDTLAVDLGSKVVKPAYLSPGTVSARTPRRYVRCRSCARRAKWSSVRSGS